MNNLCNVYIGTYAHFTAISSEFLRRIVGWSFPISDTETQIDGTSKLEWTLIEVTSKLEYKEEYERFS